MKMLLERLKGSFVQSHLTTVSANIKKKTQSHTCKMPTRTGMSAQKWFLRERRPFLLMCEGLATLTRNTEGTMRRLKTRATGTSWKTFTVSTSSFRGNVDAVSQAQRLHLSGGSLRKALRSSGTETCVKPRAAGDALENSVLHLCIHLIFFGWPGGPPRPDFVYALKFILSRIFFSQGCSLLTQPSAFAIFFLSLAVPFSGGLSQSSASILCIFISFSRLFHEHRMKNILLFAC